MNIHLTPQEKIILSLLAERGISNKQIARHLHISESTVKLHMGHLLAKYAARNRTQLVIFARDSLKI